MNEFAHRDSSRAGIPKPSGHSCPLWGKENVVKEDEDFAVPMFFSSIFFSTPLQISDFKSQLSGYKSNSTNWLGEALSGFGAEIVESA